MDMRFAVNWTGSLCVCMEARSTTAARSRNAPALRHRAKLRLVKAQSLLQHPTYYAIRER